MIHCLLATGQGALWIVVVPLLAIVGVAVVLAIGWRFWIWRGGRGDQLTAGPDSYVPFLVLAAVALLVGAWLYSLGFMQGVWSR